MKISRLLVSTFTLTMAAAMIPGITASAATKIKIDAKHFPDKGFRQRVSDTFDWDQDGYISSEERTKLDYLYIYESNKVSDISGIEYLTWVKTLYIESDYLKNPDFSKAKSVKNLAVRGKINSIDFSKNPNLEDIWIDGTKIKELDFSKNNNLKTLLISGVSDTSCVKSVVLPSGSKLESVNIQSGELESLDVSKVKGLKSLTVGCSLDKFNSLNLGPHKMLKELEVFGGIESLDVSTCPKLEKLVVRTLMKSIDVSKNKALKYLDVSGVDTEELDISCNPKLEVFDFNLFTTKELKVACGQKFKSPFYGGPKPSYSSSDSKIFTAKTVSKKDEYGVHYAFDFVAKMTGTAVFKRTWEDTKNIEKTTVKVLYKDVTNKNEFWYEPTYALSDVGIVKGYANQTEFRPANDCTRAQMVTFLWRLAGEPAPKAKTTDFKDVKKGSYYYKAVIWAVEQGITTGINKTKFAPDGVCTRAQTVTFLWRMAGKPDPKAKKCKFSDVKESDYFYKATIWASEKKIVAGYSDGTFQPSGKCLRRQMVTFLYKYDKYVN